MAVAERAPTRFGWYHGWNIVAVGILSQVAALALSVNCFSLFLPYWAKEFSTPISVLAFGYTLFSVVSAVCAVIAGVVADRFPARWIFGLALIGLAVFHAAIGFATAAWQIIALYAVAPATICFAAAITCQAVVSRWFVRRRGVAMGLTALGTMSAGVVFPVLVVWLLPLLGWRVIWWIFAAAIALIVTPIVVSVTRDRPGLEEGQAYLGVQAPVRSESKLTVRDILSRRNFWVTAGVLVPNLWCASGAAINVAPLVTSHGLKASVAGALLALLAAAAMTSTLTSGALADRMGNRIPLALSALCSAVGTGFIAFGGAQLPLLAIGFVLLGLSQGIWTLLASISAAEFGAEDFGRAYGLFYVFVPVGAAAAPILARSAELSGSYVTVLVVMAVLALGSAGVAMLMREKHSRPVADAGSA
jgi:MFS family permease